MSGGGGSGDAVMNTNLIPSYIPNMQAWAETYLSESFDLSVDNYTPYSGSTYATRNANETNGIAALIARATSGSAIEASGETYLGRLFAGSFIGSNPTLDTLFQKLIEEQIQKFEEETLPAIEDAHAFSFGGSEHNVDEARAAEKMMEIINAIAEKVYFDDYATERKLQNAGLDHAIPYGQRGIRDAELLRSAGVYNREWTQGLYKDNWAKWNEAQTIYVRNLNIIGNAIRTVIGTSRSSSTPYYKPPAIVEVAGAALSGLSLYGLSRKLTMNAYDNPAGRKLPVIDLPKDDGVGSISRFGFGNENPSDFFGRITNSAVPMQPSSGDAIPYNDVQSPVTEEL